MLNLIRQNLGFFIPYLIFLLLTSTLLFAYEQGELHLLINKNQSGFFNFFFSFITHLGDGITAIIVVAILLFIRFRSALLLLLSYLLSSGITQLLKHYVFDDALRPAGYFESSGELTLVPGVVNHYYNSFPSGHSATVFCVCACLAMISNNNLMKSLYLSLALLIGFSRVYISQHFLGDVVAGSVIGITCALIFGWLLLTGPWSAPGKLDKRLI